MQLAFQESLAMAIGGTVSRRLVNGSKGRDKTEFNDEITLPQDIKSEGRICLGGPIPVLPMRDSVLFPLSVLPLTIGRGTSLKLLGEIRRTRERYLGIVTQRDSITENPLETGLYGVGTLAVATKEIRLKDYR